MEIKKSSKKNSIQKLTDCCCSGINQSEMIVDNSKDNKVSRTKIINTSSSQTFFLMKCTKARILALIPSF